MWGGGGRNDELFNGSRVSVLQEKRSSGDWLSNNVNVMNTTDWRLKAVKMVKFTLSVF